MTAEDGPTMFYPKRHQIHKPVGCTAAEDGLGLGLGVANKLFFMAVLDAIACERLLPRQ